MTKHITEQPWYDYQRCLTAADAIAYFDTNKGYGVGSIFQVWVTGPDGVSHPFYALMIDDKGKLEDRYRMCLYREPLIAQRMLRDLPTPEPKKKRLDRYMTGYNPKAVIVDDYWKP